VTKSAIIDVETVRCLLRYEPDSGLLFWRERHEPHILPDVKNSWNTRYADKQALTYINPDGYRVGKFNNTTLIAHRAIWAIVTGQWPTSQIDHINGIRTDNRFHNLRDVSNDENHLNLRMASNNTSGITGVYWSARTQKWVAQIQLNGKQKNLGYFLTKEEAATCRANAEKANGFHANHGSAPLRRCAGALAGDDMPAAREQCLPVVAIYRAATGK